jgi:predicted ArsR family transcriptional regulator
MDLNNYNENQLLIVANIATIVKQADQEMTLPSISECDSDKSFTLDEMASKFGITSNAMKFRLRALGVTASGHRKVPGIAKPLNLYSMATFSKMSAAAAADILLRKQAKVFKYAKLFIDSVADLTFKNDVMRITDLTSDQVEEVYKNAMKAIAKIASKDERITRVINWEAEYGKAVNIIYRKEKVIEAYSSTLAAVSEELKETQIQLRQQELGNNLPPSVLRGAVSHMTRDHDTTLMNDVRKKGLFND